MTATLESTLTGEYGYLAGPMSGYPKFNYPAFEAAAESLRSRGHWIICPTELDEPGHVVGSWDHDVYLRRDLHELLECGWVCVLPGWRDSSGARTEVAVARGLGLPVVEYPNLRPVEFTDVIDGPSAESEMSPVHEWVAQKGENRCRFEAGSDASGPVVGQGTPEGSEGLEPPIRCDCFIKNRVCPHVNDEPLIECPLCGQRALLDSWGVCEDCFVRSCRVKALPPTGETIITNSITGAKKGTKPARFDLIPPDALWQVAEQYGAGATKYDDRNWEAGYEWSLSFAAMQRHAWTFWNGQSLDPETHTHHLAAVVFHAFALMTFEKTHPELDNRAGNGAKA